MRGCCGDEQVEEAGARLSAISLDHRDVRGGVERNATIGLNWYPERNVKLMANYVNARIHPPSSELDVGRKALTSDIFVGRLQIYW